MKINKLLIGGLVLAAIGAVVLYKRNADAEAQEDEANAQAVVTAAAQAKAEVISDYQQKEANPILKKYPIGTLLRVGSNPSVYLINDLGQRQWISSRAVFDRMHLNMADVKSITQDEMNKIPIGTALSGLGSITYLLS